MMEYFIQNYFLILIKMDANNSQKQINNLSKYDNFEKMFKNNRILGHHFSKNRYVDILRYVIFFRS